MGVDYIVNWERIVRTVEFSYHEYLLYAVNNIDEYDVVYELLSKPDYFWNPPSEISGGLEYAELLFVASEVYREGCILPEPVILYAGEPPYYDFEAGWWNWMNPGRIVFIWQELDIKDGRKTGILSVPYINIRGTQIYYDPHPYNKCYMVQPAGEQTEWDFNGLNRLLKMLNKRYPRRVRLE